MLSAVEGWLHSVHSAHECSRFVSALSAQCFEISVFHRLLLSAQSTVCGVGARRLLRAHEIRAEPATTPAPPDSCVAHSCCILSGGALC